jgi:signal peptidase II
MQAARGTSVEAGVGTTAVPRRARLWGLFAAVAAVLYAGDVITKILAVDLLTGRSDVHVFGDVLKLHLTRNAGAAFSTGTQFTVALTCVAIAAVVVVLWLSRRVGTVGWAIALGALLAGIAGNLTDRLLRHPSPFRGHVIDFLQLPNWPVFNLADICINVGAALVLLQAFRGIRINGSREHRVDADETAAAEPEPAE